MPGICLSCPLSFEVPARCPALPIKDPSLTTISLALEKDLLLKIKEAAKAQGMNQSAWIRSQCIAALPGSSGDKQLVDDIKVVDERAKGDFKDLIARVEALEDWKTAQGG